MFTGSAALDMIGNAPSAPVASAPPPAFMRKLLRSRRIRTSSCANVSVVFLTANPSVPGTVQEAARAFLVDGALYTTVRTSSNQSWGSRNTNARKDRRARVLRFSDYVNNTGIRVSPRTDRSRAQSRMAGCRFIRTLRQSGPSAYRQRIRRHVRRYFGVRLGGISQ